MLNAARPCRFAITLTSACLLCLLHFYATGQGSVAVGPDFKSAEIKPGWLTDTENTLTIDQVSQIDPVSGFRQSESSFLTFGTDQARYWLYFTLDNRTPNARTVVLRLNRRNIESFNLWQRSPGEAVRNIGAVGTQYPGDARFMLSDGYSYTVVLQPGRNEYWAESYNHIGSMYLSLSLYTQEESSLLNRKNILLLGVFLGVMLLSFVFSCTLFVQYREATYLLYCIYIVNILIRELYNYSADFGLFSHIGHQCISSLIAATYGLFFVQFVQLSDLSKRWYNFVCGFIAGIFIAVGLIWIFHELEIKSPLYFLFKIINVFFIFFTLNALYLSLRFYRVSSRARLAFWAFIPLSFAFIAILLRNLAVIPAFTIIQHAVVGGFIFEVIAFTIGFSRWHLSLETDRRMLQLRLDMEQQEKQLAIQAAEQRVKDQIARDLHDDVAASMSGIRILSQVAYGQLKGKASGTASLMEQINQNAQATLDSISDLIWAVKPHPDYMNDMADRMRDYAGKVLDAKDIDYLMDIPRNLPVRNLDIETRRNVYLIFKEAVNNAMKYSNCSRMEVSLHVQQDKLVLRVADDGAGFENGKTQKGNGLRNMEKRAGDINADFRIDTAPGKGTEVMVVVPL